MPPRNSAPPHLPGLGAIALAALLWALAAAVASDLFRAGVDPLDLAAARAIVATGGFAVLYLSRARSAAKRRSSPWTLIAFGLSIAAVNAAYYLAIDHLAVAVAIVLQYTAPAFVVVYSAFSTRTRPSTGILGALALALLGVVIASELPAGNLGELDATGILFGLASGVLFATYTLLSEGVGSAYGSIGGMLRAFAVASVVWIVFLAWQGWPAELFEAGNVLPVLYVGLAGTLAPFLLYVWAIQRVAPERAAIAATLEPAFAGLVAWAWLGQSLSAMQLAGGVLVLTAILALQAQGRKPLPPEP